LSTASVRPYHFVRFFTSIIVVVSFCFRLEHAGPSACYATGRRRVREFSYIPNPPGGVKFLTMPHNAAAKPAQVQPAGESTDKDDWPAPPAGRSGAISLVAVFLRP